MVVYEVIAYYPRYGDPHAKFPDEYDSAGWRGEDLEELKRLAWDWIEDRARYYGTSPYLGTITEKEVKEGARPPAPAPPPPERPAPPKEEKPERPPPPKEVPAERMPRVIHERAEITVKVRDKLTHDPIPAATVRFGDVEKITDLVGETDYFYVDPYRSYIVKISAPFYRTLETYAEVGEPKPYTFTYDLEPKFGEGLSEDERREVDTVWEKVLEGLGIAWEQLTEPLKETFRRFMSGVDYVKEHWPDILIDAILTGVTWTALEGAAAKLASKAPYVKKLTDFFRAQKKDIPRLTPEGWVKFVKQNPVKAAEYFTRTSFDKREAIIDAIRKDKAAWDLFKDALLEVAKTGAKRSGKPGALEALSALPKAFGYLLGLLGLHFGIEWAAKELPELLAIPFQDAIRAKDWETAKKYLPEVKKAYETAIDLLRGIAWLNPLTREIFEGYAKEMEDYIKMTEERIEKETARVARIICTSNVRAWFYLGDELQNEIPTRKYTIEFDAGEGMSVVVTAKAEGYEPKSETITIANGEEKEIHFELEKAPIPTRKIKLTSEPPGAEVWYKGEKVGTTPYEAEFPVTDRVDLTLKLEGYRDEVVTFYPSDVDQEQHVELTPEYRPPPRPEKGTVEIISDPPEVSVWSAGELLGTTDEHGELTLELTQGTYDMEFTKDGYVSKTKTVIVRAGERTRVTVKLEPEEKKRKLWRLDIEAVDPEGNPLSAKILVNGYFTGKWTPDYVLLLPGEYVIRVEKAGYKPAEVPITLEPIE